MYTILLLSIIGFLIMVYIEYKDWGGLDFGVIIVSLLQTIFVALAALIIALMLPVKYETTSLADKIVTLKDNNSLYGSFFLGTWMIEGRMKYVYYQQNADSTYQMQQVDYYKARIRYVDSEPKIVVTDIRPKECMWNKFALDLSGSDQTYIFEVPKGSIKNGYELDAQ